MLSSPSPVAALRRGAFRHAAALVAIIAATPCAASAQNVITLRADSARRFVAPSGKLAVPVSVDMSAAGGTNLASLSAGVAFGTSRLTFDSVKAAGFGVFSPTTTNAAGGSITLAVSDGAGTTTTTTIATMYFTASPATGGTTIAFTPSAAATNAAADILSLLKTRALDVCVATAAIWGDVNGDSVTAPAGDGAVNIVDAQQLARFSVGLSTANRPGLVARGDVNSDGSVNIVDAQQIARFSVGLSAAARTGAATFIVPAVASVALSPGGAQNLNVGATLQMGATARDAGSADITPCTGVTWSSNNLAVATVSASGLITGVATGSAVITAASGGATNTVNVTVAAPGPPAGYSKAWTGATSTSWSDASNWNPAGVPSSTDSTLIPLVANQPSLTGTTGVGKLTIAAGAVVTIGGNEFDILGNLNNAGSIVGGFNSWVYLQAYTVPSLSLNGVITAQAVTVAGSSGIVPTLSGNATITGTFSANNALDLNAHTLTVNGGANLFLKMTHAVDSVIVSGRLTMNGLDEGGLLTAGTIVARGDFWQNGPYESFRATGTHQVVMNGSVLQHIKMFGVINRYSHFNDLVIDNPAGVSVDSVNFDPGGFGSNYYGGLTEVARNLTILNGTVSGTRGSYMFIGGTLTDAVGGRFTMPKLYFDSSATPVATPLLSVPNVYFNASVTTTLSGDLSVSGNVYLISSDTIKLNGHALTIGGQLTGPTCCLGSGNPGMLLMTNAADALTVAGGITLNAPQPVGTMTAGTITSGGAFVTALFQASGTHKLVMNGTGTAYFGTAAGDSTNAGSHLNDLEIANTAADTLITNLDVVVNGMFTHTTTGPLVLWGNYLPAPKLIVAGVNVTQPILFLRQAVVIAGGGPVTSFANATFRDPFYQSSEDQSIGGTQTWHLQVIRGGTGTYTFPGLTFDPLTAAASPPNPRGNPWFYVNVQGPSGLDVTLTGASPTAAGGGTVRSSASGGATLTWTP